MRRILMSTNLAIDDKLLLTAQRIAGIKTKKETVNLALKEFIQRRKQERIIDLFGTVDLDDDHNFKQLKNSRQINKLAKESIIR